MPSRTDSTGFLALLARVATGVLLAIQIVAVGVTVPFVTATAAGDAEAELAASRDQWQNKYRLLLRNKATLNENIVRSEQDYAQAQRRNYPRGGARQMLLTQAAQARTELVEVEKEIADLLSDARRQGVPPGWLAEVDSEEIEPFPPAAPSTDPDREQEDDGRNPLYRDDDR